MVSPSTHSFDTAAVRVPATTLMPVPESGQTILLLDSLEINRRVLRGMLRVDRYNLIEARNPLEALVILSRENVDLIVADLMLPEIGGLEFCRRVKGSAQTRLIPIVLLTSVQGLENEVASLESGADEFLLKPVQPAVLRSRVKTMLRAKRTTDSLEEAGTILFALAKAVESKDKVTGDHCQRLASLSVALGSTLGLAPPQLQALHQGGYLHDIGKIAVPDAVLFKNGPLTEDEWKVMRAHTIAGEQICRPMRSLAPVIPIIRSHHERWDGSGYPDGLMGDSIPLLARILQLADIYDALTSVRPYKRALTQEEAVEVLQQEVARGWRDPELVAVFLEMLNQTTIAPPAAEAQPMPPISAKMAEEELVRASLRNMGQELLKSQPVHEVENQPVKSH